MASGSKILFSRSAKFTCIKLKQLVRYLSFYDTRLNVGFPLKMADIEKETVLIDGSFGEGGGQIIRNSVSYACLLRRRIEVKNIRANRPKPGLASQHLESILAIMRISGATTTQTPKKLDTEFDLNGTAIPSTKGEGVSKEIDLVTAGSVTLCIQCILPYLLTLKSRSKIRIIGGTHVMKAPTSDYLENVFIPIMKKKLGYEVSSDLLHPGYFPRGGGVVDLKVDPFPSGKFKHFEILQRGKLRRTSVVLYVSSKLEQFIPRYKQMISGDTRDVAIRYTSNYACVEYFLEFENSYSGFSCLVEARNPTSDQLFIAISNAQSEMRQFLETNAALDKWMQDQLIIYMALAKISDPQGKSSILTVKPTDHTLSAIHVSQLFTPENQFSVVEKDDKTVMITI